MDRIQVVCRGGEKAEPNREHRQEPSRQQARQDRSCYAHSHYIAGAMRTEPEQDIIGVGSARCSISNQDMQSDNATSKAGS